METKKENEDIRLLEARVLEKLKHFCLSVTQCVLIVTQCHNPVTLRNTEKTLRTTETLFSKNNLNKDAA
jgi:hypothetical protein